MRHNHFSMLPEKAFSPRAFGGMTLEGGLFGGGGGGGGGAEEPPKPTRGTDPRPIAPYISAGGGFQGRGAPANRLTEDEFNAEYYLKQNPDVAKDPYYGQNPFHHYQDFGFAERRKPSETAEYLPSQQPKSNIAYQGLSDQGLVDTAYANILGREADPAGRAYYQNQMRQGLTGQGLVAAMTASPEFQRQREFERAYTEAFRPDYKEFGPSGQFYQPIYQSGYRNYEQPSQPYRPSYAMQNPFEYVSKLQELGAKGAEPAADKGIAAANTGTK
jgi:hypothetical protein